MIENILVNKSGAELAGERSKTEHSNKQHKTNNTTEEMRKYGEGEEAEGFMGPPAYL